MSLEPFILKAVFAVVKKRILLLTGHLVEDTNNKICAIKCMTF